MASKRAKKPKPPPSVAPHDAVILAVDTAQRSGWAVYVRGELVSSGEVDMLDPSKSTDQRGRSGWNADRVCLHALWEVGAASFEESPPRKPVVLVFERPFRGTTQGQWIGAWKAAWALSSGHRRRVVGVYPSSWRARVLGPGWASRARDEVRAYEAVAAHSIAKRTPGPDEGTAILIGKWGAHAGEVAVVLPKRAARRKVA